MKLRLFLLSIILASFNASFAQAKTAVAKPSATDAKPKIISTIGGYKDSIALSADKAKLVMKNPLIFKDEKGKTYRVASYMFVYRSIEVSEDESGKPYLKKNNKGEIFNQVPMPVRWTDKLDETLKKGEQILLTDIFVYGDNNKLFKARPVTITIL